KIAAEASKQCNRAVIPTVAPVMELEEALSHMQQLELKLIPYEAEEKTGLRDVLEQHVQVTSVGVLIGPEGGFDQEEIKVARDEGLLPVRLGKRILRTETAPLAVIAALMYAYGEIN
ncbi:MAG: RNA methyltransferase, partial [Lachnospiraceae bacterium]|nr:RNA methyltransferase [Lachnospiraceae bacterium]